METNKKKANQSSKQSKSTQHRSNPKIAENKIRTKTKIKEEQHSKRRIAARDANQNDSDTFDSGVVDPDPEPVEVVVERGEIVDVEHDGEPLRRPRARGERSH